jgi:hypothetical protein
MPATIQLNTVNFLSRTGRLRHPLRTMAEVVMGGQTQSQVEPPPRPGISSDVTHTFVSFSSKVINGKLTEQYVTARRQ